MQESDCLQGKAFHRHATTTHKVPSLVATNQICNHAKASEQGIKKITQGLRHAHVSKDKPSSSMAPDHTALKAIDSILNWAQKKTRNQCSWDKTGIYSEHLITISSLALLHFALAFLHSQLSKGQSTHKACCISPVWT